MGRKITVAVFDLDGTLSRRDTYLPYLLGFLIRHPWRVFRVLGLPWVVARFYLGYVDNTEVKRRFLEAFLRNVTKSEVDAWTGCFVARLLQRGLRHGGLAALVRHQAAGDVVILMSASLDIYVHRIGAQLGFDLVICTEVQWEGERVSGKLASPNCHGLEKVHRFEGLKKMYKDAYFVVYADHYTDIPLLLASDRGVMVNATRKTARLCKQQGIEMRRWT